LVAFRVTGTVNYEPSVDTAEMYLTWGEYIHHTVDEVNEIHKHT